MIYKVFYKKIFFHYKGYLDTVCCFADFESSDFESAAKYASKMNEHNWRFHNESSESAFYFVKEF